MKNQAIQNNKTGKVFSAGNFVPLKKIPVYIVTGFLGSGKSTFLEQIIDHFTDLRIGIIQNEFAPSSHDGRELKHKKTSGFDMLEINNGSVFCVCLLSGFKQSLKIFVDDYHPDILIIEASGLSDPLAVSEIFQDERLKNDLILAGSICIVDAKNFERAVASVNRVKHQVMIADVIILNKIDLAASNLDKIEEMILGLNPYAVLISTTYCRVDMKEVIRQHPEPVAGKISSDSMQAAEGRPDIRSSVFRTAKPIDPDQAKIFIKELSGKSIRIKGYVRIDEKRLLSVQAVMDQIKTEWRDDYPGNTELIVMSDQIGPSEIRKLFKKYTH